MTKPSENDDTKRRPEEPEDAKRKGARRDRPFGDDPGQWRAAVLLLLMLLMVFWLYQVLTATNGSIPYSEFKRYLAAGRVTKANVYETEIKGEVRGERDLKAPDDDEEESAAESKTKADDGADAKATDAEPEKSADTKTDEPPAKSDAKTEDDEASAEPAKDAATKEEGEEKPKSFHFVTTRVEDEKLVEQLEKAGVEYRGVQPSLLAPLFWGWILPLGILVGFMLFFFRRIGAGGQSVLSFAKSRAKLVADRDTGVDFGDVAGCDEAKEELEEIVQFLRDPKRFERLGAKIPKGALLVGPPGTGKTLLARAVAGEAKVPFFSMSGSDFVEMFVGVGAARVRDLFEQAKRQAPCIIFIDEMDAIGRQRGVHLGMANDEREQTLNQLLVEMDGFEANAGVIILAATNRPDVLDRALLRPGRFDRQVVVDAPDAAGREKILKVHSRDKKLAADIDLATVARATPGFVGADLANAMNEAALLAARRDHEEIGQRDIEDAVEKVVAGPERRSRRLSDKEKRLTAYHEVGHGMVAAYCENADPVHKISIIPRGRALGYTLQLPQEDQFALSRSELLDRVRVLLGGRAAEEIVFDEITTGAQNDLERATALAEQMVCKFGMSETIGLMHVAPGQGSAYLPNPDMAHDCSPQTAREAEVEVKRILDGCYQDALRILQDNREQLENVTKELMETETLDATRFKQLLGQAEPEPEPATDGVGG